MSSTQKNPVLHNKLGGALVGVIFNTSGGGMWSSVEGPVVITSIHADYSADGWGSLYVNFDIASWDVDANGLIYTDDQFLEELQQWMIERGVASAAEGISYSEQGMQGDDYVHFDLSAETARQMEALWPGDVTMIED